MIGNITDSDVRKVTLQIMNYKIEFKKEFKRRRDVQLQTLSRTQLDQIDSQVFNPAPQTSR